MDKQRNAYCPVCQRQTLHTKPGINHVLHLILTLVTLGLWGLFVWLPLALINMAKRPNCTACGTAAR